MEYPPLHGHVGTTFLADSVVIHVIPLSCHLVLSVAVAVLWLRRKFKGAQSSGGEEGRRGRPASVHSHRVPLWTSLSLALFYLLLYVWNYFFHHHDEGRGRFPIAECDLAARTFAWLATSLLLGTHGSGAHGFPILLRIWWCLFFVLSCCSLVLDMVHSHGFPQARLLLLHLGSLLAGLILSMVSLFGGRTQEDKTLLHEPLLNGANGHSTPSSSGAGDAPPSLFADAGILSVLTFSWIGPLLSAGHSKSLDLKDVPQVDGRDTVSGFFPGFKRRLEAYSTSPGARSDAADANGITSFQLAKALVLSTWEQVAFTAVLEFISTVASFVGPYLINYFVQYLGGDRRFASEGLLLVCAFLAAKLVVGVCSRQYSFSLTRVGIRLRGSLVAMIYQKGLKLSSSSRQHHSSGKITNYISVDAGTVGYACDSLHSLWQIPLQIVLALLVLYSSLGLAALIALSASFIIMLVNIPLSKLMEGYIKKLMEARDDRMKATSETLRNMRVLKLQAWEMKFLSKILDLRNHEVRYLWKYSYTQAALTFLFFCSSTLVSALTFGACMLMGIPLRSGNVLTALATLNSLQEPVNSLPFFFQHYIRTKVSLDRISSFLRLEELQPDVVQKLPGGSSEVAIQVINASFSWNSSVESLALRDLDFRVLQGMKVAVCGTTGSGKSSLLSCLLGEVPKMSGSVQICGTVAYVPQSAWILSGTVQENILFGKEMDIDKYDRILDACSLKKDLEIMAFGDQTIIGERGINLSGGQKQRVQIARAMYHDSDIYLFDDPFSAVDAHTGSHLYKELLLKMLRQKTVVYVTHQVEFLPSADLILVIKDGRIEQAGKYNDILNSGTNFMELVKAHGDALASYDLKELTSDTTSTTTENDSSDTKQTNEKTDCPDELGKEQLVQEEERMKGKVEFKVYWRYITMAYKGTLVPLILLVHVLYQIFRIGSTYWMALAAPLSDNSGHVSGMMLIAVYIALTIGSSLCMLVGSLLLQITGFKTATLLFDKMHTCIFRAPMAFFDSTPSGRILNRVSGDQNKVDLSIPSQMYYLAFSIIQLLGSIVAMSQVSWQVLMMFIPVIAACIWYQQFYLVTSRELSRLTGVCNAPIIHHFAESLSGSLSIRCFGQENRFMDTNCKLVNDLSRLMFHNSGTRLWLSFRVDMLSSLTFTFTLICLVLVPVGLMNPGIAGVSVIYGLRVNGLQRSLISNLCNIENAMISVERILQYTSIPSEPSLSIEGNKLDSDWPSKGEIDILNLQVKYRPNLPLVLKGFTFTFPGGKKIGIVGRTGSGKSTLIQAIFRIMEPAVGQISIDGIDISSIGLHDLRSRLSIIPQDPTMFKGTLRSNLDPLEEYNDEQIWKVLDCCQLGEVRNKELKLDSEVTENGENWSVGQRQLVCLARVILKRSKILILDEATASVDTATDNVIQRTLRQEFSQSTVITVAHRITSVLDSDIVLVLDNGVIAECDEPDRLISGKSSMFAKLVSEYMMRSSSQVLLGGTM